MSAVDEARIILDPKKLKLPPRPPIEAIEVEDYVDWEGKEGLSILAILGEDTTDADLTGEAAIAIKTAIHEALLAKGIGEFPHISFAKRSELEGSDAGD